MVNDILTTRSEPLDRPDQHPQLYNSHFSTTGQAAAVRYTIGDELWQSFTVEQVTKQIGRLYETGRFRAPNNGGPFVVRVSCYAVADPAVQGSPVVPNNQNLYQFYDFGITGNALSATHLARFRRPGSSKWTTQQRQDHERAMAEGMKDRAVERIWWEKDYICVRSWLPPTEFEEYEELAIMAADVVVILLQDRTANKIEIAPSRRPKLDLNFLKRRPQIPNSENLPEVLLTIPRCVYSKTSGKTGKPHGPHRMHFRAEHVRQQPYGPRSATSYKEIVIAGTWINASDIPLTERGTPLTRNYRFKAARAKKKVSM
jgi:hypothetical protein